jgi:hypothetical protein
MANDIKEVEVESNWYEDYDKPSESKEGQLPIFEMKLKDGQIARSENVVFLTEGKKATTRFGATIIFNIRNADTDKVWFIKTTQYNLLNPIAKERKKGTLVGREATVTRAGSGQKDTKWQMVFK